MQQTIKSLNGVDVDALVATKRALTEQPELARFTFKATNRWINGPHARVTIEDFEGFRSDDRMRKEKFTMDHSEPPVVLGKDEGPNPVEYVLTALSGCLTTVLVYYAAALGIELKSVRSELEGDLDARGFLDLTKEVRNGYSAVRVKYHIESDAPRESIEELLRLAQQFSPVFDIVSNPVPVSVTLAD
ncbi:MAG: OsmC family protein [Planctomycetota bacterium]